MEKVKSFAVCLLSFLSIAFLLINPESVSVGAIKGITVCGEIIIPSIFIFSVMGTFIITSNCTFAFEKKLSPITNFLFSINGKQFIVFLISLFGGYPVGAKLIDDLAKEKEISEKKANRMLCYCINAGPAFILSIGERIFSSKTLGVILVFSHVFTSVVFAVFLRKNEKNKQYAQLKKINVGNALIYSVSSAAQNMINVCAFVILFSVVTEFTTKSNLKIVTAFFEVTSGIFALKNLYFTAFLLGFSGLSVQMQIFSIVKNFKIDIKKFFLFRIAHGALSTILTFSIIKLLKIPIKTLSNNVSFYYKPSSLSTCASVCFILTAIVLVASLKNNKSLNYY